MSAPTPTATGSFAKTPLANLLVYSLDRQLTGTLVVEEGGARSAIAFSRGVPVKVKLASPEHLLGDLLVEAGHATPEARDRAVETAQVAGQLTGFVLVSDGVTSAAEVQEALAEQVMRRLDLLAALPPDAVYGYYDEHDFLATFGGPRGAEHADPLGAIWRVVRRHASEGHVQATMARLASRPLKLHRASRPARFGFQPSESAVIDVLRARPYDLEGLVGTGLLPPLQIHRIVFTLAMTRHLDLGGGLPLGAESAGGSEAVARSATPPSRPGAIARSPAAATEAKEITPTPPAQPAATQEPLTPEHAAFKAELLQKAEQIGRQNYYEILGVDPKADMGSIRSAFFQLAKVWHPDRLPRALAAHKDVAAKVFSRMTEAHQLLSNEEQRGDYDKLMKEGGATPDEQEQVQQVLRAAMAFQKAEVLARKGNWAEAEREAKFACENDPGQAEYGALYADVLSRQAGRTQFDDVVRMVNDAKKGQPDNLRVRLYRARVLQRAGQNKAAFAEFQHVAEADPRNVEAAREVRLYRMRQGQKMPDDQKDANEKKDAKGKKGGQASESVLNQDIGQLFGKLFKR